MTITIAFIALAIGLLIGWMAAKARSAPHLHRAAAERDLSIAERQKAESLAADMQRRVEASRLANALQSPTVRGSWGESTLRRCIEMAGMSEFCDFSVQETFAGIEGHRIRPDLIVRLPNKRVIAIDAKVPLSDFSLAANE